MSNAISVNGVRYAYTLSGQGGVVVFLHGWMCNQEFWRLQRDFFSSQGCGCLALDFRGHGKSEVTNAGYSIEQLADDVWEILKALNIDQVVLVGHSMGGMVAQQFCLNHAEQVRGLVWVTTLAADRGNRLISKRIELDSRQEKFSVAFDRHFDLWFSNRTSGDVRAWVKTQMRLTPEAPALSLVRSYANPSPPGDSLSDPGDWDSVGPFNACQLQRGTCPTHSRVGPGTDRRLWTLSHAGENGTNQSAAASFSSQERRR